MKIKLNIFYVIYCGSLMVGFYLILVTVLGLGTGRNLLAPDSEPICTHSPIRCEWWVCAFCGKKYDDDVTHCPCRE